MNSGSMASYRAALPQERDDEPERGPRHPRPPVHYAAVWYADVVFRDVDTGELSTMQAECGRSFPADAHHDAYAAAKRWAIVMGKRHGGGWVQEWFRDGEMHEMRVWPPPDVQARIDYVRRAARLGAEGSGS